MSYIVAWTEGRDPHSVDHYRVEDTYMDAQLLADHLSQQEDVYCWAITRVLDASEPHWIGSHDPRIEEIVEEAFSAVFRRSAEG